LFQPVVFSMFLRLFLSDIRRATEQRRQTA
jgi:hypothetical protein